MFIKLFGGRVTIGKDLSQFTGRADDLYSVIQPQHGVDYSLRRNLDEYKNVVYNCVSLIGESLGDYKPYVMRKKGDQWEKEDHEFIELLHRPGGDNEDATSFSMFDLFEATGSFQLLQGDCFWYMALAKGSGRPREIVVLRPDRVGTSVNKKTGKVEGYYLRRMAGDPLPLEIKEVLRFPLFNPVDPYKGKAPVDAGKTAIQIDESTSEFTKNFFDNNAGLSGILSIKGEVTKGAFRKFVRSWREKHTGVGNAGKVAILRDSDASFEKVGLGLDELDMKVLRDMTIDEVMSLFKVPKELLGKLGEGTGLGRANIETLEYIFAKYNIDKKMKRFDAILQFAIERYYPEDANEIKVVHENIIPDDKEFELQERIAGVDKWLSRNEVRDEEGLDSIEGGDQLFVPAMNIPLNESSLEPPASKSIKIKVTTTTKKKDVNENWREKAERFRLSLMRNQMRYERQYRKTVKPIFKKQHAEALNNLEAHASSIKASGQKLFDDAVYDKMLLDDLMPMLTDLTETQGQLALVFAGDVENEFHMTSSVTTRLQRGTLRMAQNFNDETIKRLNETLAEGVRQGEALAKLKKRVDNVYGDIDGYRSLRIARTETLKASNGASVDAYRQTGYVVGKQWYVNPDACEQCAEFDGKTIGLDDSFLGLGESYSVTGEDGEVTTYTNDYDTVEEPPLHPNCRCGVIPVR